MKKNRMMRLASVLLVAVLMTTCTISGTFAKYVSEVKSEDTARVANWGFKPAAMNITDLFAQAYDLVDNGNAEVQSSNGADVIAPGTWGKASFVFNYDSTNAAAPEVDYTFVVSTAGSSIAADIENNTNIKWRLDEGTWGTWDALIKAIEDLDGNEAQYEAGTLPAQFNGNQTHTIEWKWAFDVNDNGDFDVTNLDTTDTAMGNGAVDALAVTLRITVTATQVD